MKMRTTVAVLFLLALCSTVVSAFAQDKAKPAAAPAMGNAEMEAMMKAASPGEPQKKLARLAGDWTFTNTMWMAPGQPPVTSTGTMHGVLLMGGRYVEHTWKGDMMGMPFEGRGTDGYDNVGKQYVASWLDNMGTGIVHSSGTCDEGVKVCTYNAEMWDPMSGKKTTSRSVITWLDDNNFKNEMYGPGPDGKEAKMMEIAAKRK
jgi:hypothetical protein